MLLVLLLKVYYRKEYREMEAFLNEQQPAPAEGARTEEVSW
jgi:hypothetical protein